MRRPTPEARQRAVLGWLAAIEASLSLPGPRVIRHADPGGAAASRKRHVARVPAHASASAPHYPFH